MTSTAVGRPLRMGMGSLEDPEALGRVLASSGFFSDTRDAAQAVVKVLAGQELGFGPIASMTGVYIVKGRVTLSANLLAAAIKRHPRYDFRVRELTNDRCEIVFFQDGEEAGTSDFTMADAQAAGLASGENWRKYPRNMLFARAISNGAKFFVSDVFAGAPVYTPDELGADIDPETGEILNASYSVTPDARVEMNMTPAAPAVSVPEPARTKPVDPPTKPKPKPVPAVEPEPEPEPVPEPAAPTTAESFEPVGSDDPDGKLTDEEAEACVAYLHRMGTPETMWRMALMTMDADTVADLTRGQARELMRRARQRFGTPETA
jgi:hypothetical protein